MQSIQISPTRSEAISNAMPQPHTILVDVPRHLIYDYRVEQPWPRRKSHVGSGHICLLKKVLGKYVFFIVIPVARRVAELPSPDRNQGSRRLDTHLCRRQAICLKRSYAQLSGEFCKVTAVLLLVILLALGSKSAFGRPPVEQEEGKILLGTCTFSLVC